MNKRLPQIDSCVTVSKVTSAANVIFNAINFNVYKEGDILPSVNAINKVYGIPRDAVDIREDVHEKIEQRTDKTWLTTWFMPILTGTGAFKDMYSVITNWGANHGTISYGNFGADYITLASILHIPVSMHNVNEDKIFRPRSWATI